MADYTIFTGTSGWATPIANNSYEIDSTEFYTTSPCWVTALRFYRPTTTLGGTIKSALYRVTSTTGNTSGTEVPATNGNFTNLSGTGWQTRTLPEPVELTVGQRYRVAIKWGTLRTFSTDNDYWTRPSNVVNGPLVAPNNANASGGYNSRAQNSNSSSGAIFYPTAVGASYAYPIDVVVTDVNPAGTTGAGFLPFFA